MKKKFYHATDYKNLQSILDKGIIPGCDGIVYLTELAEEALRFMVFRFHKEVLVLEIELEESDVEETFDHSYSFFKCKAFGYQGTIPVASILNFLHYEREEN